MSDQNLKNSFTRDVALMSLVGMKPVIVHGGGPQIAKELKKSGISSNFISGHRVTDKVTMSVVKKILGTKVNHEIVNLIKKTYPEIKILVLRIFPRGGDDEKGISPPVFKSSEKCINICHEAGLLTKQLADGKQVYWMDINKIFLLENGKIDTKKMWDLLHPSPSGAEAWAIAVRPTLLKLINNEPVPAVQILK